MATKQAEAKGEPQGEAKAERVKASEMFEHVSKVLRDAGPEGFDLAELSERTGIRARVLHNVTYHLEKAGKVRRIQEGKGKKVRYASTEVKAKPATRSRKSTTTARKATSKAA